MGGIMEDMPGPSHPWSRCFGSIVASPSSQRAGHLDAIRAEALGEDNHSDPDSLLGKGFCRHAQEGSVGSRVDRVEGGVMTMTMAADLVMTTTRGSVESGRRVGPPGRMDADDSTSST
ncbi:hypothetical protein THAOC_32314 [Thalassiosira oceanica]|uniref:Uncharacterized protein n=1 Tax=Thalassiosira oceanica TaxID=159749 RepID=K0R9F1_THAOC|nr:hypothetical protein THAOC_32314 [Thalassiosira oceanica]|eukprot:EJK48854.1 hypothetical protein THAOC_32314 [Thalassiosira oceanica]